MKVYQRIVSFMLTMSFLFSLPIIVQAWDNSSNTSNSSNNNGLIGDSSLDSNLIGGEIEKKYKQVMQEINNSSLPKEVKEMLIQYNNDLFNLAAAGANIEKEMFAGLRNVNEKPINVEMTLKYKTIVYGEPSGPHPLMVGETKEPWLLGESAAGTAITNKYHPPLINNKTAMSDRDWIETDDAITKSLIDGKILSDVQSLLNHYVHRVSVK